MKTTPNRPAAPSVGPGRPRLTFEALQSRIAEYGRRYSVAVTEAGLPAFPAGKRETQQHREWMALYKAHRRLSEREPDAADVAQRQELLTAQRSRCPVCRKSLDLGEARLDSHEADPGVLHAQCLDFVTLARALGSEALDRVKTRL
jgi:hypothetical protein